MGPPNGTAEWGRRMGPPNEAAEWGRRMGPPNEAAARGRRTGPPHGGPPNEFGVWYAKPDQSGCREVGKKTFRLGSAYRPTISAAVLCLGRSRPGIETAGYRLIEERCLQRDLRAGERLGDRAALLGVFRKLLEGGLVATGHLGLGN